LDQESKFKLYIQALVRFKGKYEPKLFISTVDAIRNLGDSQSKYFGELTSLIKKTPEEEQKILDAKAEKQTKLNEISNQLGAINNTESANKLDTIVNTLSDINENVKKPDVWIG